MNINKKLAYLVSIAGLAIAPMAAQAADGTINFTGSIQASTCTVTTSAGAATGNSTAALAVALGNVGTSSLAKANDTSVGTPFKISFAGAPCANKKVSVNMSSTLKSIAGTGLMDNGTTGPSAATNVKVYMKSVASGVATDVNFDGQAGQQNIPFVTTDATGNGVLEFLAGYKATGATTAGAVTSTAAFDIIYF